MIPFRRPELEPGVVAELDSCTRAVATAPDPVRTARRTWSGRSTVRGTLRTALAEVSFRRAFCMYCYESRGTDVDHFVPVAVDPHLTFTWTNHLLACAYCNQQAKRDRFPLDGEGGPLLLDPSRDDAGHHMTIAASGHFIDLTRRGEATIDLLRLNERKDLVDARLRSWRFVLQFCRARTPLGPAPDLDEVEDLRFVPVVDALHHFVHDTVAGRLRSKAVPRDVARYATTHQGFLRSLFPACRF